MLLRPSTTYSRMALSFLACLCPSILAQVTLPGVAITDCVGSTCPAPPTTYASFITVDGEQQTLWVTFTATTPTTAPASPVPAGSVMDGGAYFNSVSKLAVAAGYTGQSSAHRSYDTHGDRWLVAFGGTILFGLLGAAAVL